MKMNMQISDNGEMQYVRQKKHFTHRNRRNDRIKKSDNGLKPQISPEELMQYIPQVKDICDFHAVQLLNLDSSNMEPKHWKMMVHTIRENYEKYDGFVIAHGTDTMAYTAAALSYMIQNSKKPIVITGAQKPIDLEITDAKIKSDRQFFICIR